MAKSQLQILLLLSDRLTFSGEYYSYAKIYSNMFGHSQGSIRVSLNRLLDSGEVEKIIRNGKVHFRLTTLGGRKLKTKLALDLPIKRWDGKWRVLITKNETNKLKEYAFGKVQRSTYVSPFPLKKGWLIQGLFFETRQTLPFTNRALARRVWSLDVLNKRYLDWIKKAQGGVKDNPSRLIGEYEVIIKDDPFLPRELLLPDWSFERAREVLAWLVKRYFSARKM